jgi:L-demethylnoviosyl transferase
MRVLFTTCPSQGHFYPMVPLAWAMRSVGHEVLVGAAESFLPEITGAGLPAAAIAGPMDMIEVMSAGSRPALAPDPSQVVANTAAGFARLGGLVLDGLLELAAHWRPDFLVCEPAELAGPAVARHAGIRRAEHWWGLAPHAALRERAADAFSPYREKAGLPGPADPDAVIDVCPREFQLPGTRASRRMSYIPYNGSSVLPDWLSCPAGLPRVCVTLGTVLPRYGQMESLLERILSVIGAIGAEAVAGVSSVDVAAMRDRGRLPAEIKSAQWVPLGLVLGSCDLIVHHGGSGTTMTALACGIPQVVLPHFADQFANAERVAATGVGLSIGPADQSTGAIHAGVSQVFGSPAFRQRARLFAAEMARQPSPAAVAAELTREAVTP